MFPNLTVSECMNNKAANASYSILDDVLKYVSEGVNKLGCTYPCNQNSYKFILNQRPVGLNPEYYTRPTQNNSHGDFEIVLYYSDILVESESEKLLYDDEDLLAAIGGNLGLTLGFSCLSVMIYFLQCFKNKLHF